MIQTRREKRASDFRESLSEWSFYESPREFGDFRIVVLSNGARNPRESRKDVSKRAHGGEYYVRPAFSASAK